MPLPYVLIADLSRGTLDMCGFAHLEGLQPVVVTDGAAAVQLLHTRGLPRLAIINPSLARLDGFAVLGELRTLASEDDVPAIVVSALPGLRERAHDLRARLGITAVMSPHLGRDAAHAVFRDALAQLQPTSVIDLDDPATESAREEARLAEIDQLELVGDAPPDPALTRELEEIARAFGVSTVMVSIVTRDRQFFKAHVGLSGALLRERGTPREHSFCRHLVEAARPEPLIVPDAQLHPAFADNPYVVAGVIGSYVGVPLTTPRGNVIGTLCVIDPLPWLGSAAMVEALTARAATVMSSLLRDHAHVHRRFIGPTQRDVPTGR